MSFRWEVFALCVSGALMALAAIALMRRIRPGTAIARANIWIPTSIVAAHILLFSAGYSYMWNCEGSGAQLFQLVVWLTTLLALPIVWSVANIPNGYLPLISDRATLIGIGVIVAANSFFWGVSVTWLVQRLRRRDTPGR